MRGLAAHLLIFFQKKKKRKIGNGGCPRFFSLRVQKKKNLPPHHEESLFDLLRRSVRDGGDVSRHARCSERGREDGGTGARDESTEGVVVERRTTFYVLVREKRVRSEKRLDIGAWRRSGGNHRASSLIKGFSAPQAFNCTARFQKILIFIPPFRFLHLAQPPHPGAQSFTTTRPSGPDGWCVSSEEAWFPSLSLPRRHLSPPAAAPATSSSAAPHGRRRRRR